MYILKFIGMFYIQDDAKHTAEFIDHMDQLFNAFNSRTFSSSAPMRHALSATSGHLDFLVQSRDWLGTVKSKGMVNQKISHIYILL